MPKSKNCSERDFSEYDSMSTQQLQQILQEDASKSEGEESDTALVLYVMEVLAGRKQGTGKTPQEAFKSFKELYDTGRFFKSDTGKSEYKAPKSQFWRRLATVAAIIVFVLAGSVITAYAFGVDVLNIAVKWTDNIFCFKTNESNQEMFPETIHVSTVNLRQTLDQLGLETIGVPTWLPDGFEKEQITVDQAEIWQNVVARYEGSKGTLVVFIGSIDYDTSQQIERDSETLETFQIGGNTYYFFTNLENSVVAWVSGSYQCYISGPFSLEEMKKMVNSIE